VTQSSQDFPIYDTVASAVTGTLALATYRDKPFTKEQLLNFGKDVPIDGVGVDGAVAVPAGTLASTGRLNIDDLPHAPHTTDQYTVADFNINTEPGGPDTKTATYMSNTSHVFNSAALTSTSQAEYITKVVEKTAAISSPTPTGTVIDPKQAQDIIWGSNPLSRIVGPAMDGPLGGQLAPADGLNATINGRAIPALPKQDHTHADRLTFSAGIGYVLPRYTDNLQDAQAMFNKNFLGLDQTDPNSTEAADTSITGLANIPRRYELLATKVPCAVPGVLNCTLAAYDKVSVAQPDYVYRPPNIIGFHQPDNLIKDSSWQEQFTGDGVTTIFDLEHELGNAKNAIFVYSNSTKLTLDVDYTLTTSATKTLATVTTHDTLTVVSTYATLALVTAQIGNYTVGTTFYASTDHAYYQIQWSKGPWQLKLAVVPVANAIITAFYDPTRVLKLYNDVDYYGRTDLKTGTIASGSGQYTIIGVDKS
jgi:hypothetical protein